MKRAQLAAAVLAAALAGFALPALAQEQGAEPHNPRLTPELQSWSFAGPFGKFDPAQLQRGYQVYKEVCSACHSMKLVAFRNLGDEGGPQFTDDEVKALAATVQVHDGPNEAGEMFERAGKPSDHFPSPFANPQAAAAANGGAVPPDLSVIAKARGAARSLLGADRFLHAVPGGRPGLRPRAADRLPGSAGRASRCRRGRTTIPISWRRRP